MREEMNMQLNLNEINNFLNEIRDKGMYRDDKYLYVNLGDKDDMIIYKYNYDGAGFIMPDTPYALVKFNENTPDISLFGVYSKNGVFSKLNDISRFDDTDKVRVTKDVMDKAKKCIADEYAKTAREMFGDALPVNEEEGKYIKLDSNIVNKNIDNFVYFYVYNSITHLDASSYASNSDIYYDIMQDLSFKNARALFPDFHPDYDNDLSLLVTAYNKYIEDCSKKLLDNYLENSINKTLKISGAKSVKVDFGAHKYNPRPWDPNSSLVDAEPVLNCTEDTIALLSGNKKYVDSIRYKKKEIWNRQRAENMLNIKKDAALDILTIDTEPRELEIGDMIVFSDLTSFIYLGDDLILNDCGMPMQADKYWLDRISKVKMSVVNGILSRDEVTKLPNVYRLYKEMEVSMRAFYER